MIVNQDVYTTIIKGDNNVSMCMLKLFLFRTMIQTSKFKFSFRGLLLYHGKNKLPYTTSINKVLMVLGQRTGAHHEDCNRYTHSLTHSLTHRVCSILHQNPVKPALVTTFIKQ
jgi:uncharacterized protein YbgA (DUF1722 family)